MCLRARRGLSIVRYRLQNVVAGMSFRYHPAEKSPCARAGLKAGRSARRARVAFHTHRHRSHRASPARCGRSSHHARCPPSCTRSSGAIFDRGRRLNATRDDISQRHNTDSRYSFGYFEMFIERLSLPTGYHYADLEVCAIRTSKSGNYFFSARSQHRSRRKLVEIATDFDV